jgi:hypothetical protein
MGTEDKKTSSPPVPKRDIPDVWAKNGRCPACGSTTLKVTHLPDLSDYLSCTQCEIAFEVEVGGRHIRLKYVPDELKFIDAILHGRWVEASKLSGIISKHRPITQEKKSSIDSALSSTSSGDEVWNRALRMYRMGNKPRMIQLTLIQSGLTQEQSDVVFAKLDNIAKQDAQRQNQKFWTVAGVSILVVIFLACSGIYLSGNLPVLFGLATLTPAPSQVSQPSAVDKLLDLVPDDAKPDLLNLPDITIDYHGPSKAACPATPDTAATLFGGDPTYWTRDMNQFPAWQMISTGDSVTVRVPDGMTAGYVDNKSLKLESIHGPVTISNVNFLAITCN